MKLLTIGGWTVRIIHCSHLRKLWKAGVWNSSRMFSLSECNVRSVLIERIKLCCNNLVAIWKTNTCKWKKICFSPYKILGFILFLNNYHHLLVGCVYLLDTAQLLKPWIRLGVPSLISPPCWFSNGAWLIIIAIAKSPVSQRDDVIKRNVVQSED